MAFEKHIQDLEERTIKAKQMGGSKKLERRKEQGILNVRERVDHLVDPGSWEETGLFMASVDKELRDKTPADGKVAGFAEINGREVAVVANDFTVKGSSSTPNNEKKFAHMKQYGTQRGLPIVFIGESTGVRMPDVLGAQGMTRSANSRNRFTRKRDTPWASATLGYCFGSSAWHACAADFNVMRKGSIMAVSSPNLVSMATREKVEPEDLGGWKLHSEITGFADQVVDTDEEAMEAIRKFLSYLPSHNQEAPPRMAVPEGSEEASKKILDIVPEDRSKVYDMRKVIKSVVDTDSMFEMKQRFAKSMVTSLARINGQSVGIIANNPMFKGGAIDADCCDKATSFMVLCDSFNIPIIFLVDQPGFLIGIEAERKRIAGKVINWMNAISLVTVPTISIFLRKSYGQAHFNLGGGNVADEAAAWYTSEISFMDPKSAVSIVHGIQEEEDPEKFAELLKDFQRDTTAYDMAAVYGVYEVIDPRDTRDYLIKKLKFHDMRITNGVGEHELRTWPTSY